MRRCDGGWNILRVGKTGGNGGFNSRIHVWRITVIEQVQGPGRIGIDDGAGNFLLLWRLSHVEQNVDRENYLNADQTFPLLPQGSRGGDGDSSACAKPRHGDGRPVEAVALRRDPPEDIFRIVQCSRKGVLGPLAVVGVDNSYTCVAGSPSAEQRVGA